MKQWLQSAGILTLMLAFSTIGFSQAPPPAQVPVITPLKLQVVITKYDGEKKMSSLPYSLSLGSNDAATTLKIGTQVGVPTVSSTISDGRLSSQNTQVAYTYYDVGIQIDCRAVTTADGRYRLDLSITDKSLYPDQAQTRTSAIPTLRSFASNSSIVLRDGQTTQFSTATDRVTGEVFRVDVTLTVDR